MKDKVYHLKNCDTCQRILKELDPPASVERQDIKTSPIQAAELDEIAREAGSYEALFSRRSLKFKAMGLAGQTLSEDDYRRLILQEYTFLKRPVFVIGGKAFVGNTKKTQDQTADALAKM